MYRDEVEALRAKVTTLEARSQKLERELSEARDPKRIVLAKDPHVAIAEAILWLASACFIAFVVMSIPAYTLLAARQMRDVNVPYWILGPTMAAFVDACLAPFGGLAIVAAY